MAADASHDARALAAGAITELELDDVDRVARTSEVSDRDKEGP
jgi:hypothetical protein